jgi:hypothetical protein
VADPTASFLISARDATGVAVASAERNLKSLAATARATRSIFASFGIGIGVNAFARWIKHSIEAKEALGVTAEELKATQAAVSDLSKAWDGLGQSIAKALTPALSGTARLMNDVRMMLDPTPIEEYQLALAAAQRDFEEATSLLAGFKRSGFDPFGADEKALERLSLNLQNAAKALQDLRAAAPPKPIELFDMSAFKMLSEKDLSTQLGLMKDVKVHIEPVIDPNDDLFVDLPKPIELPVVLQLESLPAQIREVSNDMSEEWGRLTESMGRSFRDSFVDFLVDGEFRFKDFLKRLAAEFATSAIFSAIGSTFTPGTFFAQFFGGFRAEGGPLEQGKWYIAGERGPEPIWGGGPGAFAAAGGGRGGPNITIQNHIDARGASMDLIARLPAILEANSKATEARIRDSMRRGR